MPQSFVIGPLKFNFYGIFVSLGLFLCYFLCSKDRKTLNLKQRTLDLAFVFGLVGALIGGRFYHVLSQWPYYQSNLHKIFFVQNGGLGIFGSVIGGFLGILIACRVKKIKYMEMLNLIFPNILLSQSIGRIGNFFNQEGFGQPTSLPWGIAVNNTIVHPTFFYESILCLIAFVVFRLFFLKKNVGISYYLISYGIIRLITESFRIDTWIIGNIKVGFILSVAMILVGLCYTELIKFRKEVR